MAEIKRVVAFVLSEQEASFSVVLAVQNLTSLLVGRHETSSLIRANGVPLIAKMKYFLEQESNLSEPSRNDFFYLMMWL